MTLLADSGSTKTDWSLLGADGSITRFRTCGLNPNYVSSEDVLSALEEAFPNDADADAVEEVRFYGAGVNPLSVNVLEHALRTFFPCAELYIDSDLLGAATALLGDCSGFAAILGTGSNTCIFSHGRIVRNVSSLGFILGDEGSGGHVGKLLLRDWMRGVMPEDLRSDFASAIGLDGAGVIRRIYREASPNTFCASLAGFAISRKEVNAYCRSILLEAFRSFFDEVVCLYPEREGLSFNAVGSVAALCWDLLSDLAREYGMSPGTVLRSPMEGLESKMDPNERNLR